MSAIKRLIADAHDTARWMESQGAQNQEGARVLDVDAAKARIEHDELIKALELALPALEEGIAWATGERRKDNPVILAVANAIKKARAK